MLEGQPLTSAPSTSRHPPGRLLSTMCASYLCFPPALLQEPAATAAARSTAPGGLGSGPGLAAQQRTALPRRPSLGSAFPSSWEAGRDAGTSSRERKSSRPGACATRSQATPRETIAGAADESTEAISWGLWALHTDARFGHTTRPAKDSIGPAAPGRLL